MSDTSKLPIDRVEELSNQLEIITSNINNLLNEINILKSIKHIVESWNEGANWYNIWSDGWIEQGGIITTVTDKNTTHDLLKPYSNTDYNIFITSNSTTNTFNGAQPDWINAKTTTTFTVHCDSYGGNTSWYAYGY